MPDEDAIALLLGRMVFAKFRETYERKVIRQDGCWGWDGALSDNGYAMLAFHLSAHRFAYLMEHGVLTPGMEIDHLCETKSCSKPDDLEEVSKAVNLQRILERSGMCRNGLHERSPENLYVHPRTGHKSCLPCKRAGQRRRYAANPEKRLAQDRARYRAKKEALVNA